MVHGLSRARQPSTASGRIRGVVQNLLDTVGEVGGRCDGSGLGWISCPEAVAMSLRPQQSIPPVPDDTARVARAAFRRGNPGSGKNLGTVFACPWLVGMAAILTTSMGVR